MIDSPLRQARRLSIEALAGAAEDAVLDDQPGQHTEKALAGFLALLTGYEAAVKATTSSTSAVYAFRDLPGDEAGPYAKAKHLIGILQALYGPKAA